MLSRLDIVDTGNPIKFNISLQIERFLEKMKMLYTQLVLKILYNIIEIINLWLKLMN